MYLNEAHSQGLISVRAHYNVIAWSDDTEELKHAKNDIGSQLASMECMPRHNTVDCPTLYWAGIPGNEGDFPAEESFLHRASGLPLHGGNELPQFALALRHQDGGQADGKAAAHRHLGFAHEEGCHDE